MRLYLRHAFAAAISLITAGTAVAQQPKTVLLEDLTWTELRDEIRAGKTTVIVPIGGVEQSGPYLALGKHNARVKVLSQRIAEGLGNAIVAPVVAYVPEGGYAPPTSHMRFPGTITVPDDVFEKTLESAANSFKVHGFMNVVFLGDHGGYQNDIRRAVAQLNKSWGSSGARAFVPGDYYGTSSDGYSKILRQHGVPDDEIGTHAGLADTSLLLAVAPQIVRVQRLRTGPKVDAADGVYGGDPRRSSVELGQLGTDAIVARTIAEITKETAGR
ncbi:TPA: creatininase family protein [Burkholderia contaminans]|nr:MULTISPECIES: creatininase family protein [Burkholderia cepacia complex]KVS22051.1 creatininase [Burkholderia vietnamiensis]MBM6430560.1 creatininase family protein [Burkholderia contaminans]MCA7880857.1 creatininase family protein [Burkholderia contaminans]MDN8025819.1 creatininase family protein [Burkholderia contaminans]PRG04165.1 creatininase [Burkholderia contaminans]